MAIRGNKRINNAKNFLRVRYNPYIDEFRILDSSRRLNEESVINLLVREQNNKPFSSWNDKFIKAVKESFNSKEFIIIFNGPKKDFINLKEKIEILNENENWNIECEVKEFEENKNILQDLELYIKKVMKEMTGKLAQQIKEKKSIQEFKKIEKSTSDKNIEKIKASVKDLKEIFDISYSDIKDIEYKKIEEIKDIKEKISDIEIFLKGKDEIKEAENKITEMGVNIDFYMQLLHKIEKEFVKTENNFKGKQVTKIEFQRLLEKSEKLFDDFFKEIIDSAEKYSNEEIDEKIKNIHSITEKIFKGTEIKLDLTKIKVNVEINKSSSINIEKMLSTYSDETSLSQLMYVYLMKKQSIMRKIISDIQKDMYNKIMRLKEISLRSIGQLNEEVNKKREELEEQEKIKAELTSEYRDIKKEK